MPVAGAKLTWEYVVDVRASSSSILGNGARKILDASSTVNVHRPVENPKRKCRGNLETVAMGWLIEGARRW
jgi:hypothetical protein